MTIYFKIKALLNCYPPKKAVSVDFLEISIYKQEENPKGSFTKLKTAA